MRLLYRALTLGISIASAGPVESSKDKWGAVASESSICSNIGIELLKRGVGVAELVGWPR
jgi:gamma-glutamyltranspeptidase